MSTAALCKGKQSRSVFNVLLRSSLHHPSSVWASLIILSCPIITVCVWAWWPQPPAICSDSIDTEIRGCRPHRAQRHTCSEADLEMPPLSHFHLGTARSIRRRMGRWKVMRSVAAQTESWPPADSHAVSPTAPTDVINNPSYLPPGLHTLLSSPYSFISHQVFFSHHYLHLWCCI